jgi:hypothetical protein
VGTRVLHLERGCGTKVLGALYGRSGCGRGGTSRRESLSAMYWFWPFSSSCDAFISCSAVDFAAASSCPCALPATDRRVLRVPTLLSTISLCGCVGSSFVCATAARSRPRPTVLNPITHRYCGNRRNRPGRRTRRGGAVSPRPTAMRQNKQTDRPCAAWHVVHAMQRFQPT